MDESTITALITSTCCLGMYGFFAGVVVVLVQLRMRSAERALGRPALPEGETALLVYSLASFVWASAAMVAIVGLAKREWARVGRNATLIFLTHMLLVVFAALAQVVSNGSRGAADPTWIVIGPVLIAMGSSVMTAGFAWRWAGLRTLRLEAQPSSGDPELGRERYAIYAAALLFWPAGVLAPALLTSKERARVGGNALRCSLVNLLVIALATCAGLLVFVRNAV